MNLNLKAVPFLTLSLFMTTVANASFLRTLDESQTIEVSISKQGLNRITVKGDRILNVFGIVSEYALEADEVLGHVFIRALPGLISGKSSQPIHLTLTTEKGHTQDLRLVPQDQAPTALILEEDAQEILLSQEPTTRDEIESLVQACQEMRIPLGYKMAPIDLAPFKGPHRLVREIRGEKLRAFTYEVHNLSTRPLNLSESDLSDSDFIQIPHAKKRDIIAICIAKKTINPGERTHVHVIAKF